MIVSTEQAIRGLMRYIEEELIGKLEGTKKTLAKAYVALAAPNLTDKLLAAKTSPWITVTGLVDEEGRIDTDKAKGALEETFRTGIMLDLPLIGGFRLGPGDLERMVRHVEES